MRAQPVPRISGGFTQVELVIVMVVLVVLTSMAIPSLGRLDGARADAAAARIRSALVYAQAWAIDHGTYTWVRVIPNRDRVRVFRNDDSSVGVALGAASQPVPDRGSRIRLPDPLTRDDMELDFSGSGIEILSASFGGGREVMFDPLGRPHRQNGNPFAQDGLITVTGGGGVRITRTTGLILIE